MSQAEEWPALLDVAGLLANGWQPTPFREFIVKVHARCDLLCDYCYVYQMADQSWRDRPRRMSKAVIDRLATRIAEHAVSHELDSVKVVLHGGEPLLAGADRLRYAVERVRETVRDITEASTRVDFGIQTNGVALGREYLALFDELDVSIGVSMDGGTLAHDRHRRHADGRGSHAEVASALRQLVRAPYRRLFSGLLCTIDLANDPIETYESLLRWDPPAVDFLLPHGNWDAPPPGRSPGQTETPYADWLIALFEHWYTAPVEKTLILIFREIIDLLLGGASCSEAIGLSPVAVLVIETDGSIEQSDILKSAYPGASHTGFSLARNTFDEVLTLPHFAARQLGVGALSNACSACSVRRICGGGQYAHRYRAGSGFANPSVYCPDLLRLIRHIRARMKSDIQRVRR